MAETGNWSPYYITEAGRNLRQLSIAEGKKMVFTRAVIGTGKSADPSTIDDMSGLVAYAKDVIIKKSYAIEANHLCIVRVDNSGYTQDVLMTEVGVYAKISDQADNQAILYGYAYDIDGYILIPAQTSTTNRKIYEITLDTYLSQSTDIKIIYDDTGLWVSHSDLDDLLAALNARQVAYGNSGMPSVANVQEALDYVSTNKANLLLFAQSYAVPSLVMGDSVAGGYFKIWNVVFFNIRIDGALTISEKGDSSTLIANGFPAPDENMSWVDFAWEGVSGSGVSSFCAMGRGVINSSGNLVAYALPGHGSVNRLGCSGVYLAKD